MEKVIRTRVISQTKTLFDADCESVTLPSSTGQITILPNHSQLLTLLEMGQVILKLVDGTAKEMLISGGTASVEGGLLTLLTEEGVMPDNLVKEEIEEAIKSAHEKKSSELDPSELIQLEKQLRFEMFKKNFTGE